MKALRNEGNMQENSNIVAFETDRRISYISFEMKLPLTKFFYVDSD